MHFQDTNNAFLISDSPSVFKSRLKTFLYNLFYRTLIRPAASASEVTTVWRYRSSIIIIIFSTQMVHFHDLPGVIFARVTVQQNCRQHRPSFTDMLTDTQSTEHTCLNGHFSR